MVRHSTSQFLEEFYPDSAVTSCPDSFTLHHYNGLVRGEGAVVVLLHLKHLSFSMSFQTSHWSPDECFCDQICHGNIQVRFRKGEAVRLEGVSGSAEGNPLLQVP